MRNENAIPATMKITAVAAKLRDACEVCVTDGLAAPDACDAVTDTDTDPVEEAVSVEAVGSGGDATAKVLTNIVAKEVIPEGVLVTPLASTTATLGATE